MHKIQFGKIKKDFPENIEEMTGPQYRYFCFLELNRQQGKLSMEDVEVFFVYFALNMVHTSESPKTIENVNTLRELVRPYYIEQEAKGKKYKIVDLNFVKNPLPSITIDKTDLLGPDTALGNCTYEEVFVHGQNAMIDFCNTNEEEYLDELVAILYRPAVKGKRPKFSAEALEENIELVKKLDPEVKFGVFLFFSSCHKFITTADELSLKGGVEVNIAQLFKPSKKKAKGVGPVGVIWDLAESNVFGDAAKTGKANVYDVLVRMVQLHEKAKESKSENDNRSKT
ncbi:hypothetical protein E0K83_03990 [Gramella sp. BOM4]|nr:hypothetical protein [Christiangramia bathymodioli]